MFSTFTEIKGSLLCLQKFATRSCSEPYQSNSHHHTYFTVMHFNIIFPAKSMSVCIKFSDHSFVYIYHVSHSHYMSHPSHTPWFHHPKNMWWNAQIMKLSIRSKVYLTLNSYCISVYMHQRIILAMNLKKHEMSVWTGFIRLRTGSNGNSGNQPLSSMKVANFLSTCDY